MKFNSLDLEKILDINKWQQLQDSLALATKMAIITVDYKGIPITKHSSPRPFCAHVRSQPDLEKYCHKCDSRGGLEAVRIDSPYIYLCHCNIIDIAVPIIVEGKYVGAIMAGQIRLIDYDDKTDLEQILISPVKHLFEDEFLSKEYEKIPRLSLENIKKMSDMLYHLCSYIVEEAMNKNLILELYEKVAAVGHPQLSTSFIKNYPIESIMQVKEAMGSAITNAYIKTDKNKQTEFKNPILRPAFDYIYEHKNENINQKHMAELCFISSSHFSRIFAKEVGEGFSQFISRIKVEWSKQLLEKTDLQVSQISDELGFCDPGYYIKVFKKYEKITPATYRKYYLENN